MKRWTLFFAFALTLVFAVFACTDTETKQQGGLVVIVTTDLSIDEMNTFRLEVSQETEPGRYGPALLARDYAMPAEATLPASITIASGVAASQAVLVRAIGRKVEPTSNTPVVLREVEVQVPSDRVLALTMILSAACAYQVNVEPDGRVASTCTNPKESCQPTSGACGPSFVDMNTLPPYEQVKDRDAALPIVPIADASVNNPGPREKEITSFVLAGVTGTFSGSDIFVSLPPGTNVNNIAPDIKWRGSKIDPDPTTPQNFGANVPYTVTAGDGSERVYTVHVSVALPDTKEITSFVVTGATTYYPLLGPDEIDLDFPYGSDVTNVTPTISFTGKSINPPSLAPQDFTNPVTYTVTAFDGSMRVYTVTAHILEADEAKITSFKINGVTGDISDALETITVDFTAGVDLTNLTPDIEFVGKSLTPPKGAAQNFTNPVTYTVTAFDDTTYTYEVTVTRPTISRVDMSPGGGSYGHPIGVKLTCKTPGAEVRYVKGAGAVTRSSTLYTTPVPFVAPATAERLAARCFSNRYDDAQQETFALYGVSSNAFDAPDEISFGPTRCGEIAAAKTFTLANSGAATTYSSSALSSFTVSPVSGPLPTNGTTITVTPRMVPADAASQIDIVERLDFTVGPGFIRTVTLRQLVTCP